MHNLNGFLEGIATEEFLKESTNSELTFIISRSTFSGSGRYVQHWNGDNQANFAQMRMSI